MLHPIVQMWLMSFHFRTTKTQRKAATVKYCFFFSFHYTYATEAQQCYRKWPCPTWDILTKCNWLALEINIVPTSFIYITPFWYIASTSICVDTTTINLANRLACASSCCRCEGNNLKYATILESITFITCVILWELCLEVLSSKLQP